MAVKQLVVVNVAVPMDFSQLTVQVSHASMLGILKQGEWNDNTFSVECSEELKVWLKDHFTLVVCKVWGKDALLKLDREAKELGLPTAVMEDYGHTTALAIGPAEEDRLISFKRLTLL